MRFSPRARAGFHGLATIAFAACSSTMPSVPPVAPEPTGEYLTGKFVWYDLLTDDLPAAQRFYGELLGWEFEGEDDRYATISLRGRAIGGIAAVQGRADSSVAQWVSWISVNDVDVATERARQAGAAVLREPANLEHRGRFALITDPQGALLALLKSEAGDPPDREPEFNGWFWTELWTDDTEASAAFYWDLVQCGQSTTSESVLEDYMMFECGGRPRAGLLPIAWEGVRPHWLPYIRVADPGAIAARVEGLGGRVLIAPDPEIRAGSVGLIQDPAGAVFAIQQWPVPGGGS